MVGGKCTNSENPSIGECFRELLLNAIPPKQHDGRTQAGTSSHMCTVPSPPLPIFSRDHGIQGGSLALMDTNPKVVWVKSTKSVLNRSVKSWDWNQNSSAAIDEAPAFLALSSCLKHTVPPHFQSMGGAGLSGAQRVHSRKAAAKALQELAPLRKPSPPESSFTPCTP